MDVEEFKDFLHLEIIKDFVGGERAENSLNLEIVEDSMDARELKTLYI